MSASEPILGKITEFVAAAEKHPRAARFALLGVAQTLLHEERVRVCYRIVLPDRDSVDVIHNPEKNSARYRGLMKCGLAWICPLCNLRIAEQRRAMLDRAFDNARGAYTPLMATYTVRHSGRDRLKALIESMHKAYREIRQSRQWRLTKEEWSVIGEIRATEITYSFTNGWHPHYHVLMLIAKDAITNEKFFIDSLENQLFLYWKDFLARNHLNASREHGVRVQNASFANHYVAKYGDWSLSKELTRSSTKTAIGEDSFAVFDLLLFHYFGDKIAGSLFKEYHEATKGKSSLQWSPNLKKLLGVTDLQEDAIADQPLSEAEKLLISLSLDEWQRVMSAGAEGHLLDLAAAGDYHTVALFLSRLHPDYVGRCVDSSVVNYY